MYKTYILQSLKTNRFYIGHTADIEKRLKQHNSGKTRSTKCGIPWKLVYFEIFQSKQLAFCRELQIKSYKSGEAFKKLLQGRQTATASGGVPHAAGALRLRWFEPTPAHHVSMYKTKDENKLVFLIRQI